MDNVIQGHAKRTTRPAVPVAAECFADGFNVRAVLKRDAAHNRSIACVCVCCRVALMIVEEDFADTTIRKAADGGSVSHPRDIEFEGLAETPGRKPLAWMRHDHVRLALWLVE